MAELSGSSHALPLQGRMAHRFALGNGRRRSGNAQLPVRLAEQIPTAPAKPHIDKSSHGAAPSSLGGVYAIGFGDDRRYCPLAGATAGAAGLAGIGFRPEQHNVEALQHYRYRWLEKRSGGLRLLEAPKPQLRSIQRRILHELLEHIPPHAAAHGFRKKHSCLSNAERHVGQHVVVHFDLQDFFLHVRGARVSGLFRTLGYPEEATRVLTGLCTHRTPARVMSVVGRGTPPRVDWALSKRYQEAHLPQGAPTSPYLANLCAFRLDLRLHGLAERLHGHYSRYADDLVFSGGRELAGALERFMPLVGAIVLEEGFVLNHHKTRVMRMGSRQKVTGIVVNQRPNLVRADYDALKATLFNCARYGFKSQNLEGHLDYRAHLLGKIAHVRHIHPARGARLLEMFSAIVWEPPA